MDYSSLILILLLLLLLLLFQSSSNAHYQHHDHDGNDDLVRSSCSHASYPAICLRTLSNTHPHTLTDLARVAVETSYRRAGWVSDYLTTTLQKVRSSGRDSNTEKAALGDCLEQLSDAVSELRDTLRELAKLNSTNSSRYRINNAETWVSAALTDQDTCMDGINAAAGRPRPRPANYKSKSNSNTTINNQINLELTLKIKNVAMLTSNALYFINRLDHAIMPYP